MIYSKQYELVHHSFGHAGILVRHSMTATNIGYVIDEKDLGKSTLNQ